MHAVFVGASVCLSVCLFIFRSQVDRYLSYLPTFTYTETKATAHLHLSYHANWENVEVCSLAKAEQSLLCVSSCLSLLGMWSLYPIKASTDAAGKSYDILLSTVPWSLDAVILVQSDRCCNSHHIWDKARCNNNGVLHQDSSFFLALHEYIAICWMLWTLSSDGWTHYNPPYI